MRLVIVAAAVLAAGCGAVTDSPNARVARAQGMTPADARLASLYHSSCSVCHTNLDSKAPLAGDAKAWAPRLAKGIPALVQSAVNGFNGMPAGGQCFECTAADHEALIRFMAKGEGAEKTP